MGRRGKLRRSMRLRGPDAASKAVAVAAVRLKRDGCLAVCEMHCRRCRTGSLARCCSDARVQLAGRVGAVVVITGRAVRPRTVPVVPRPRSTHFARICHLIVSIVKHHVKASKVFPQGSNVTRAAGRDASKSILAPTSTSIIIAQRRQALGFSF